MKERKNIYFATGRVRVELKPPTKTLKAHWIEIDFTGAIVSGMDEDEAREDLTSANMFSGKDRKWLRGKKIQIITVNFKFLNKTNYY